MATNAEDSQFVVSTSAHTALAELSSLHKRVALPGI